MKREHSISRFERIALIVFVVISCVLLCTGVFAEAIESYNLQVKVQQDILAKQMGLEVLSFAIDGIDYGFPRYYLVTLLILFALFIKPGRYVSSTIMTFFFAAFTFFGISRA